MTQDQDFSSFLRARVDEVGPVIAVDTSRVVPRARRRRTVSRIGGALSLTLVLGGAGWVLDAQPWSSTAVVPAGHGGLRVAGEVDPTPTAEPSVSAAAAGWPDAPFWHTVEESHESAGQVHKRETWSGHTKPGMFTDDGDLANAMFAGPSGWGNLLINGKWTLVSWDVLYTLPTDPTALEALFRASVEPDRGQGTDDDKIFSMVRDMQLNNPGPPALTKALWTIMAGMPNAKVTPGIRDHLNRPGSLIEYTGSDGAGGASDHGGN